MQLINRFLFFIPLVIGFFSFFIVFGLSILDPTNISWLRYGDAEQHYLGWIFFRNSDWSIPIGLNPNYGLELSSSIVFTDSIPILAIIFKILSGVVPDTFQYFGFWILLCFVFQSYFSWKLAGLITNDAILRSLFVGLVLFAPPMIMRSHMHITLTGHFLVLASLYFLCANNLKNRFLCWLVLAVVSALVHAYFLAMVLIVWFFSLADRVFRQKQCAAGVFFEFITVLSSAVFFSWLAGYFSVGSGVSLGGFGYYRMNLLSLFDSDGSWSYILGALPKGSGDFEGFNYLGLGVIVLLFFMIPTFVKYRIYLLGLVIKYRYLSLLFLSFTLFAVSNKVAIGNYEFSYYLPSFLISIFEIFRSSGRFFWPVFYFIIFVLFFLLVKKHSRKYSLCLLSLVLLVQVVDSSGQWLNFKNTVANRSGHAWETRIVNAFWDEAATHYTKVRSIPVTNQPPYWQDLSYFAGVNKLATNAVYLARVGTLQLNQAQQDASQTLEQGRFDSDSIYILDDSSFYIALVNGNADSDLFTRLDGFNLVAPGWRLCSTCTEVNSLTLQDILRPLNGTETFTFSHFGNGLGLLAQGWSDTESWGTWTSQNKATIVVPILSSGVDTIRMQFNAFVTPHNPVQTISMRINGVLLPSWSVVDNIMDVEFKVPAAAKQEGRGLLIELDLPDAVRPADIGIGNDIRRLAMGLVKLELK